jgi:hypothetical protein
MKKTIIYLMPVLLLLTSCFKEDEMITPHDPGSLIEAQVDLGEFYPQQVYFDLSSETSVSDNQKDIWDLALEASPEGWHILLNTACFMTAAASGSDDFNADVDTVGYQWNFDPSDGNLDSTAIGRYFNFNPDDSSLIYTNEVYIINRGYNVNANLRGLKKIVFQMVNDSAYTLRYANLDGSEEHNLLINKDELANFSYFSFDDGGKQLYPEPPKQDYDLLFTQYTTLLFTDVGDPYPYLLTGVLLNRQFIVEVARDTSMIFDQITYESTAGMDFSRQLDIIGYDWKDLEGDVTGGGSTVYYIVEGLHYVVRDTEGYLYKLRFTSFYNNNGVKGHPQFEYQRL